MDIVILIVYIVLYLIAINKIEYAIFFHVFFYAMRDVADIQVLSLFKLNAVFIFILFFHFWNRGLVKKLFVFKSNPFKYLVMFAFVYSTVMYLNNIRQSFLLVDYLHANITIGYMINEIVKYFITFINLAVLLKYSLAHDKNRIIVYKAMVSSLVVIVLSIYFAPLLESIGMNARGIQGRDVDIEELDRISGLFMGGDVNALSSTLNLIISIMLVNSRIEKRTLSNIEIGIIILLITGVFLTASRMGFLMLVFIFTYYFLFFQTRQGKEGRRIITNTIKLTAGFLVIFLLLENSDRLQLVFQRMSNQGITNEIERDGSRSFRWIGFISFSLDNLIRASFGSNRLYYAYGGGVFRDPHNFFIRTLYLNGIFILSFFVYYFYKLHNSLKKMNLNKVNLFLIIPMVISMTIISQISFIYFYLLFIGSTVHQEYLSND